MRLWFIFLLKTRFDVEGKWSMVKKFATDRLTDFDSNFMYEKTKFMFLLMSIRVKIFEWRILLQEYNPSICDYVLYNYYRKIK